MFKYFFKKKKKKKENEITFFPPPARKKIKPEISLHPSFHSQPNHINGDMQSDTENNNTSMNCIEEEAISETELSDHHLNNQSYTKLNHQHNASINHQINTMQHKQNNYMADKLVNGTPHNQDNNYRQNHMKQDYNYTSQKNDNKSPQNNDHQSENIIIQDIEQYQENVVTKGKINGFLEESGMFEKVEVDMGNEGQIGEGSPQYENRHDDKNNDLISVGSSDSEIGENLNNQINEFDDVNNFSFF